MKAIGKLPRTKKLHVLSNEAGDHKHEEDQGAVKVSLVGSFNSLTLKI